MSADSIPSVKSPSDAAISQLRMVLEGAIGHRMAFTDALWLPDALAAAGLHLVREGEAVVDDRVVSLQEAVNMIVQKEMTGR